MTTPLLETPKQLAERSGLSERQIRHLIKTGELEHVRVASRVFIATGEFEKFLTERTVKPCQDETKDHAFAISISAKSTTSPGPSTVAAASARLVRQTASKLKSVFAEWLQREGAERAE